MRFLLVVLAFLCSPAWAQQSDFDFYRNPDKALDLSHFGYPSDRYYNLGKTAASASGVVFNSDILKPVQRAHWWFAATFCGGSLELYDIWNERQLAAYTDPRCTPIASGVYVTDEVNRLIASKKGSFLLIRGMGLVQVYSSTLSVVW